MLNMYKEADNTSYRKMLSLIDAKFVLFKEFMSMDNIDGRYVLLRHDLDRHVNGVLEMAQIEYEMGVRSTYFPLHTASYFDYSIKFIDLWKKVNDLGHEVGLHNNFLGEYLIDRRKRSDLKKIISKPIEYFRNNNISIRGTSSHGISRLMKFYGVRNYEIWKDFYGPRKGFKQFYMKEFDLVYETYHIDYDLYLTDTKRQWTSSESKFFPPKGHLKLVDIRGTSKDKGYNIIKFFNEQKSATIQILVHVPRWRVGE